MQHKEAIKLLLKNGDYIDTVDFRGETPLFAAPRKGQEDRIKLLLEDGAVIDFENHDGETPLHGAIADAKRPAQDVMRLLVDNGASIDYPTLNDRYPGQNLLHMAIANGQNQVVQSLLCLGLRVDSVGDARRTPLHLAVMYGNEAGLQLLLNNAQLLLPEEARGYADMKDRNGDTPLNLAIWHDYDDPVGITELLLKNGADPNSENYWGNTPLSGAAVHDAKDIARVLLEYGADPNAPGNYPKSSDADDQLLGPKSS